LSWTHLVVVGLLQDRVLEELVRLELEQELEARVLNVQVLETNVDKVTDGLCTIKSISNMAASLTFHSQ
jgi:hypothetical protein